MRQAASRACSGSPMGGIRTPNRTCPVIRRPAALADPQHAVEGIESSPDLDHHLPARCRKANSKGPALEYCDAKLILEPGDAPADRRRV